MAGLLRDSEHEDNDAEMGRVAKTEIPCLHLEAMESPEENKKETLSERAKEIFKMRNGN
mgnify:CR=1 FL=1